MDFNGKPVASESDFPFKETVVSIDPAGNVWAANNWNLLEAAADVNPSRPTSTWGGGSGFTVIYGVAAPVKPPRVGKVQPC